MLQHETTGTSTKPGATANKTKVTISQLDQAAFAKWNDWKNCTAIARGAFKAADDARLEVAKALLVLRTQVEAEKGEDAWWPWFEKESVLKRSRKGVEKLLKIAKDPDPAGAIDKLRADTRKSVAKTTKKKKGIDASKDEPLYTGKDTGKDTGKAATDPVHKPTGNTGLMWWYEPLKSYLADCDKLQNKLPWLRENQSVFPPADRNRITTSSVELKKGLETIIKMFAAA
jgi:hypothetical protein